jgi:hypothetical protein
MQVKEKNFNLIPEERKYFSKLNPDEKKSFN